MNKTFAIAALAFAASFGAHADEADASQYVQQFEGSRTRAEVQADLTQYKKAGVNPWSTQYNQLAQFKSGPSRADVRADYIAARDQVAAMTREDSGSAFLARANGSRVDAGVTVAGQPVRGE